MAKISRTERRMLAWLFMAGAGFFIGYFSFELLSLKVLLNLLVGSTVLFAGMWALGRSYRGELSKVVESVSFDDIEIRQLMTAIRESKRRMDEAIVIGALCLALTVAPWLVDSAGYVVTQLAVSGAFSAALSIIFLCWLFYDLSDEIDEFKIWVKQRERDIQKRTQALKQFEGGYQRNSDLDVIQRLDFTGGVIRLHPPFIS